MNFVTINKRTMKFKSKMTNYKYETLIPSKAVNTIIIDSHSENIHPSIWKAEWFLDKEDAVQYLKNTLKKS